MIFSPCIEELMAALQCLPSVGAKSAQRMALHLLHNKRAETKHLSECLQKVYEKIVHCQQCNNFSETALCPLCTSPKRDSALLCVVESPIDVAVIEQANYRGRYYVLMGHLSPLDGIGPRELELNKLLTYIQQHSFEEVILATNPTVEGEATAHYIVSLLHPLRIKITRIAHGVPYGGELEYIDHNTLERAMLAREIME